MATRTTRKTVTFANAFTLGDFDEVLPAGNYAVDTDEDLIQGLSFSAYIRVLTIIHLPAKSGNALHSRALTIDPDDLDAALLRDRGSPALSVGNGEGGADKPEPSGAHRPSAERLALEAAENEGMRVHLR